MQTNNLLLHFILFFPIAALTQSYTISGNVIDENNLSVPFSNVVLLDNDSEYINGTITNDSGDFRIENLQEGTYKIKVSYLGFETFSETFELYKNVNFEDIVLIEKAENLKGVTVVAKKPTVKRLIDRTVFNVENTTMSNYNVLDVLKYTPGVMVSDGKISVKNGEPLVFVNDKRLYLSISEIQQLLEGTSAQNLKSIEVISNPPAKYDAEGGAVINIVLSKNLLPGYNGSVFGNIKQGFKYPKYSLGTSHYIKANKLNTYFSYNIGPRKDYRQIDENVKFKDENNFTNNIWETDFRRTKESSDHILNANIDYDLSQNDVLSLSANALISPELFTQSKIHSETEIFNASYGLDSILDNYNNATEDKLNIALSLDYKHTFKDESELIMNMHHTNYDFTSNQNVSTDYFLPNETSAFRNNQFQTNSKQKIEINTGQIDYENSNLEAGVKYSNITSENLLNQYYLESRVTTEDFNNSNIFLYDESNYAAYASYFKDWEKWNLKLGLRTEYTQTKGNSVLDNQMNKNDYLKLFPSFYLQNRVTENDILYFNYNRRIFRPRYNQLNPFKFYLNNYTYILGNPSLKPQIDDIITLGYTINDKYTFEVYYRYENDPALEIVFQDNANPELSYINTNIDNSVSYGLDFTTYTQIIKRWDLYVLSSVFFYQNNLAAINNSRGKFQNNKWTYYTQIVNYFSFLEDYSLTADLSAVYILPVYLGPTLISERFGIDFNLRKSLWSNRASLSLGISDIFNTQNFTQTTNYLNQDVFIKSNMENRLFVFGFNYKFGNHKLKAKKGIEKDLEERNRLESNSSHN